MCNSLMRGHQNVLILFYTHFIEGVIPWVGRTVGSGLQNFPPIASPRQLKTFAGSLPTPMYHLPVLTVPAVRTFNLTQLHLTAVDPWRASRSKSIRCNSIGEVAKCSGLPVRPTGPRTTFSSRPR